MKQTALIFLFFITFNSFVLGQNNTFTLSGIVTDCRTKDLIKDVAIKLVGSDGCSIETMTDSSGHYFFDGKKINPNRQYVVSTQASRDSYSVKNPKTKFRGYINTGDKSKFSTYDSVIIKNIKKDFCLIKNEGCTLGPPLIYFQKNSIENFYYEDSLEEGILWIVQLLKDNPNVVFEVGGHAGSDEKNPEKLAYSRAKLIRDLLILKGIETDRLILKSYGEKSPFQIMDENNSVLHSFTTGEKSRRVSMKVLRKDYVPKNPTKEKTTPNPSEE